MRPFKLKFDEEKSKHASVPQQNGFGPAFSHSLRRLVKGTAKFHTSAAREDSKKYDLPLPVSD
jgi:hypothetical protein